MTSRADHVAQAVLAEFEKLPPKRKPVRRDNGLHEWIPLSGIVAEKDGIYSCLALATGMKCLPASKIPESKGIVLHDWHAEVLAMRMFNRHLLDECHRLLVQGGSSEILEISEHAPVSVDSGSVPAPFRIKEGIKLHMYCSEAPCGDASMELTMAAQDDATPWEIPAATGPDDAAGSPLVGREFFSQLGVVRRKPGRGDAPPTFSKSCSDKIAMKQCTSLLCGLTSLFVEPQCAYIDTLVVPESQYTEEGYRRAFSPVGRLKPLEEVHWQGGYSFRPFTVETTRSEFCFSKKSVSERSSNITSSNMAAAWSTGGIQETIVGGVVQGRKSSDPRGAARASRRLMYTAARDLSHHFTLTSAGVLGAGTYGQVKQHPLLARRREVISDVRTSALRGWVENTGDSEFYIDTDLEGVLAARAV